MPSVPEPILCWSSQGLWVLVLTETWERFSSCGMCVLLVFFLIDKFRYSDAASFAAYGSYTALVYISPIFGALIADRYLGFARSVTSGGVLMMLGHVGLAMEDVVFPAGAAPAPAQIQLFHLSLALLIVGVGLLKPNISAMVGELYPAHGHLRDSSSRSSSGGSISVLPSPRSLAGTWARSTAGDMASASQRWACPAFTNGCAE